MNADELGKSLFNCNHDYRDISGLDFELIFNKTPDDIVEYLESQGIVVTAEWRDFYSYIYDNVFTISGVNNVRLLQDVHNLLVKAIADNVPFSLFKRQIRGELVRRGWVSDDNTDVLTSPWRMMLIYRQTLTNALNVGRYYQMLQAADDRPYWQYGGVLDRNTRNNHRDIIIYFQNRVLKFDHPFWRSFFPPNGFNCRCYVRNYTQAEVAQLGYTILRDVPDRFKIDDGFNYNPALMFYNPSLNNIDEKFRGLLGK